tara:strand:- start:3487 stop:4452 length:966 start_codon:yes stop_codon:yes gene_type:complete
MSPQFVDFNADGHTDIVTATYEGTAFVVYGGKAGFLAPEHITDKNGENVQLSQYYDYDSEDAWKNTDRGMPKGREDHCVSTAAFDWDNDGDLDLLLGAYEGGLFLQMNEGTKTDAAFTGQNVIVQAAGKPLEVKGGMTAPRLVDWDKDGLMDLVCGGFDGGAFLYRNNGKLGAPSFEASVTLLEKGQNGPGRPLTPETGCYVDPVDYDGDGDLDLLVGGYAQFTPQARELNDEEKAELAKLDAEMAETEKAIEAIFEGVQKQIEALGADADPKLVQELYDDAFSSKDFEKVNERQYELSQEIDKLRPSEKRKAGIWLVRQS